MSPLDGWTGYIHNGDAVRRVIHRRSKFSSDFLLINTQEKFEVLTAVHMTKSLFWVSSRLVYGHQHFG